MFDQTFHPAQARGVPHQPDPAYDPQRVLPRALDPQGQHAAVPIHLPRRNGVSGMIGQARVVDAFDPRMAGQRYGNRLGVGDVARHAASQGPQPPQDQPGVERGQHPARDRPHAPGPFDPVSVFPKHERAALHVAVPAQVLGHGMHGDIGAVLQGPLHHRGGEGVVYGQQGAGPVCDIGHRADVDDVHGGIRRGFRPEQFRIGPHGVPDRVEVGHVHVAHFDVPVRQEFLADRAGNAVDVFVHQHVGARSERLHAARYRRHARRVDKRRLPILDGCEGLLQPVLGRVAHPDVHVVVRRLPFRRVLEGGREMNGRRDGARIGFHPSSRVDQQRIWFHGSLLFSNNT